jgi:tetratricopeptide (TPR) repeat protein
LKSLISGIAGLFGLRKNPATPSARPSGTPSGAAIPSPATTGSEPEMRLTQASETAGSLIFDNEPAPGAKQPDDAQASISAEINAAAETETAADWQARFDAARQTRRESGPAAALPLFEALCHAAPDRADSRLEAAACLRALHRFDQAETMLADLLQTSPSDINALHDLARLLERRGAWTDAEALWRRFVVLPNAAWWGHSALATTLQRQGRLPEADQVLSEALSLHPDEILLSCDYARLAHASGNRADAKARWEAASARFPDDPAPLLGLAAVLKQEGDMAGAERLLRAAVRANPDDFTAQNDLARFHEQRADWTDAEQIWRRLRGTSGAPWWTHSALAATLQRQGRLTEADAVLSEALALHPSEAGLSCDYARLAQASGNQSEAKARWEDAGAKFPDHPAPLLGRAAILTQEGDLAGAERLLRAATRAHPDHFAAQHDLARFLEQRGDWAEAEQIWRRRLDTPGAPWWVHASLAAALRQQDRPKDAEAALTAGISQHPAEATLYVEYAKLAAQQGDWPEAQRRWSLTRSRFPANADATRGLAMALRELGEAEAAEALP